MNSVFTPSPRSQSRTSVAVNSEPLSDRITELADTARETDPQREVDSLLFAVTRARIEIEHGDVVAGRETIGRSVDRLTELVREKSEAGETVSALAWATFYYWEQFDAKPVEALELIPEGFLPAPGQVENCRSADLGARFALTRGEAGVARRYVDYALAKGYFEPGFIDFCRRYELCELP